MHRDIGSLFRSDIAHSALTRAVVLPVGGVALLLSTAAAIRAVGPETFGIVSLLVTLPAVIPVSDLGLGGLVTTHLGRFGWDGEAATTLVRRTALVLIGISVAVIAISGVLCLLGTLPRVLNFHSAHADIMTFVVVSVFSVTIPLGLGGRVLLGLRRQASSTLIQGLTPVYGLALLGIASILGHLSFVSVVSCLALAPLVAAAGQCLYARRAVRQSLAAAGERSPSRHSSGGTRPFRSGWRAAVPLMVISICSPIAFQSDRIVLSNLGTAGQLSRYSLASTLAGSVLGIVAAGGTAMWPYFQRLRSQGQALTQPVVKAVAVMAVVSAFLSAGTLALGPAAANLVSSGQISPGYSLWFLFSSLILVTGIHYPLAMALIAFDELVYCACWNVLMMIGNLTLSVLLVPEFGANGPIIGSTLSTLLLIVVPFAIRTRACLSAACAAARDSLAI